MNHLAAPSKAAIAATIAALVACGARAEKATQPEPEWTRADWLRRAGGFIAQPSTMPHLNDPKSRAVFEKLVGTRAWLEQDDVALDGQGARDIIAFFSTFGQLAATLKLVGTVDETVALSLFGLEMYKATLDASAAIITAQPDDDPSKSARLAGLDKMRLGAAIHVCGLLYAGMDASQAYRTKVFDRLSDSAWYPFHSREGLQLILATLEDRLIVSGRQELRASYERIRDVVAKQHHERPVSNPSRQVIYQAIGPPGIDPSQAGTVVSTTGKFAVDGVPGALAQRVQIRQPGGAMSIQDRVDLQAGQTLFEAICLVGVPVDKVVQEFSNMRGVTRESSGESGHWFTANTEGREGRLRIIEIAGRACMASVEGPAGQVPAAQAHRFLSSLRPAPQQETSD